MYEEVMREKKYQNDRKSSNEKERKLER